MAIREQRREIGQGDTLAAAIGPLRRRVRAVLRVRYAIRGLCVAVGLCLIPALLDWAGLLPVSPPFALIIPLFCAAAIMAGWAAADLRPSDPSSVIRMVEGRVDLKQRLSSAFEFARLHKSSVDAEADLLLRLQREDAETHARAIDPEAAVPRRLPQPETWILLGLALLLTAVLAADFLDLGVPQQVRAERRVVQTVGRELAREARKQEMQARAGGLNATRRAAEDTQKLAARMASGKMDKSQAIAAMHDLERDLGSREAQLRRQAASGSAGAQRDADGVDSVRQTVASDREKISGQFPSDQGTGSGSGVPGKGASGRSGSSAGSAPSTTAPKPAAARPPSSSHPDERGGKQQSSGGQRETGAAGGEPGSGQSGSQSGGEPGSEQSGSQAGGQSGSGQSGSQAGGEPGSGQTGGQAGAGSNSGNSGQSGQSGKGSSGSGQGASMSSKGAGTHASSGAQGSSGGGASSQGNGKQAGQNTGRNEGRSPSGPGGSMNPGGAGGGEAGGPTRHATPKRPVPSGASKPITISLGNGQTTRDHNVTGNPRGKPSPSVVPYGQGRAAPGGSESAIDREDIPPSYRDAVRRYFESLHPSK